MTFETSDQIDEGTWSDQQKYNDKDKYKYKYKEYDKDKYIRENLWRATLETYDLWEIWSECWGDMDWPQKR